MRERVGLRVALISRHCRHNARANIVHFGGAGLHISCGQTAGFGQFVRNRSKLHNKLPLQRNQAMLASALGRHSARIATALAIVTAGSSFVAALPPPDPCRCRSAQSARWPVPGSKRDLPEALVIALSISRQAQRCRRVQAHVIRRNVRP